MNTNNLAPPLEMKLELTHACPLACRHCSSAAGQHASKEMSMEDCSRIVDQGYRMGVKEVALSGGEPFCWPHLLTVVQELHRKGMKCCIYTCGNAPDTMRLLHKMCDVGLDRIILSIFSDVASEHDSLTLIEGSHRKMLKVAKGAVGLGVNVEFHFVPLADNYRKLGEIVRMASRLGVGKTSVLRFVPQGRGDTERELMLSAAQNMELRRAIVGLREQGFSVRVGDPYGFLLLSEHCECSCASSGLTVGPDLRVFPCDAFKGISPSDLGVSDMHSRLSESSLEDCWYRSPYFNRVREFAGCHRGEECLRCNEIALCGSGCMAQKFHHHGKLISATDPMCIRRSADPTGTVCGEIRQRHSVRQSEPRLD